VERDNEPKGWREFLDYPLTGRKKKPRHTGLTMVMDKGLGLTQTRELLELGGDYIDFIKLGFGTPVLYSTRLLQAKIQLARTFGVDIYPGGTFLEIAMLQKKLDAYLHLARELGFTCIEVSDGTMEMTARERAEAISKARMLDFRVITEVGKKDARDQVSLTQMHRQIEADLEQGAYKVIVEGRESGKSVVIYDRQGAVKTDALEDLVAGFTDPEAIIWEAPLKTQQQELILRFGPNVNLGNIPAEEVLALEALRLGLRGDTLRATLVAFTPGS
jgi:phosphosulfolactate synthase